ncbi:MAG TPA: AI-2E family transporter [Candidatus Avilachnospira avistercoris]|nr:AI-2E family transporter [Candidatus Avilachnospira avistercoris]
MNLNDETVSKIKRLIVFTVVTVILGVNWRLCLSVVLRALSVVKPFIIGGCLAFVLNIPMKFIESKLSFVKKPGPKRGLGILITLLLWLLIMMFVILMVIPQLGVSLQSLRQSIPGFFNSVSEYITRLIEENPDLLEAFSDLKVDWNSITSAASSWISGSLSVIIPGTVTAIASIASSVTNGVITFIFALYLLIGKEKLLIQGKSLLRAFTSERRYLMTVSVLRLIGEKFSAFVTGQCLEACILGSMFVVTLSVAGMPYAMLIGVLVAVTALIPVFGAFIGCVIGAFLMLMQSPVMAIVFIIIFLVIQQIEGNLIYPHVVGGRVDLPAIWVLVAVTTGGSLFGIIGMIAFIPAFSVLYALLRSYVRLRNAGPRVDDDIEDTEISAAIRDVSERLKLDPEAWKERKDSK